MPSLNPTLYTVAYPECGAQDLLAVDAWRAAHDAAGHALVRPHFTLVFACNAVDESTYMAHVAAVAARTVPIAFHCRYAMLGADAHSPRAHACLVPDEGYAALSLLHDALYTGPLADQLRLDLPYTPHITVGTFESAPQARQWCVERNHVGVSIPGRVGALWVGQVTDGRFDHLGRFDLVG
ncbi:MAG: 2'-5' RNA ligase family protein [Acidovorax sp.]|uniref:2'-5' RNA ligase family protein n=1 Tax=Acidovorax sp. TaxID=1872122 RepID=UPI00391B1310